MSVPFLNTFLFSLGMMGNFCFLQVPYFVVGNFYRFKNEGYLLEIFKMRFFQSRLNLICKVGIVSHQCQCIL